MKHLANIHEVIQSHKDWTLIAASCLPEMSLNDGYYNLKYMVQDVNGERTVIYALCECVSGKGVPNNIDAESMADCKHSAALFFYINSNVHRTTSKTDVQYTWKEPSKKKLELYPPGQTFQDRVKNSSKFKRNYLEKDEAAILKVQKLMEKHFSEDLNQRGLYRMITFKTRSDTADTATPITPELPVLNDFVRATILKPLPHEIPTEIFVAIDELENMPNVLEYFFKHVVLDSKEDYLLLFQKSIKQAFSDDWIEHRGYILNSSTADKIYKVNMKQKLRSKRLLS